MPTLTKGEIERRIIRESEELSQDMLSEVLDFMLFLKVRHNKQSEAENTEAAISPLQDIFQMLPQHELGEITGTLSREDFYTDAR